jgi:hypothetical protein
MTNNHTWDGNAWSRLRAAIGDLDDVVEESLRAVPRVQRYTEWAVS